VPAWTGSSVVPLTLDGGSHGKEKESQKSSEEKEEEESSKKESEKEVGKEIREEKSGQEEVRQEEGGETQEETGQESCGETGCANGGNGGSSAFHGGNARGKNCPEPCSSLALSDGFKALSGLRMDCGRLEGSGLGLDRRHSGTTEQLTPACLPFDLSGLSGHRAVKPGLLRGAVLPGSSRNSESFSCSRKIA
jgi:hypothetical protein